jgi:hypothetical protein
VVANEIITSDGNLLLNLFGPIILAFMFERRRKTKQHRSQYSGQPTRDLNQKPSEYKLEALPPHRRLSVLQEESKVTCLP